jgi:plastocyanin
MTRRPLKRISLATLALTIVALGWAAARSAAHDIPAAAVEMLDLTFSPATVTIQAGETVQWKNTSKVMHTATSLGPAAFDSGTIDPGKSYSRKFDKPGTYKYFCIPHEKQGMTGTVIVK